MNYISLTRFLAALLMLGYSAWKDIKTREITDLVWIIFASIGGLLDIIDLLIGKLSISDIAISIGITALFAGIIWYLSLLGEADILALIALSIIQPTYPELVEPIGLKGIIFTFSILSNSALIGALTAVFFFIRNLIIGQVWSTFSSSYASDPLTKKIGVMFTGLYIHINKITGPPFQYPLEKFDENGERRLLIRPNIFDDEKAEVTFQRLKNKGFDYVWVSYSLPFLSLMLLGLLTVIFLGDLIFSLIFLSI